jgi:hypothetical protein
LSGKRVLLVFFALLFLAIGIIFWMGATGGGTANRPPGMSPMGTSPHVSPSSSGSASAPAHQDGDR